MQYVWVTVSVYFHLPGMFLPISIILKHNGLYVLSWASYILDLHSELRMISVSCWAKDSPWSAVDDPFANC